MMKSRKSLSRRRRLRIRAKAKAIVKKRKIRRRTKSVLKWKKRVGGLRRKRPKRSKPVAAASTGQPEPVRFGINQSGTVPVVFIHRGDDDYLAFSLQQAKRSNPQSDVVLIGDASNGKYASESVHHCMIDRYFESAGRFAEVYKHQSGNAYDYELFCFQRWFVLKDFMKANGLERCCYLDSDIMLYANVNDPAYHGFTNVWAMLTINTMSTLEDLCYLIDVYFRNPDLYEYVSSYSRNLGFQGLNDMVFSSLFLDHWPQYKQHLDGVFGDSFFDGNIRHPLHVSLPAGGSATVEMLDGKKKVYRRQGELYAKAGDDYWVKINSLHFQGETKSYMAYFLAPGEPASTEQVHYFDFGSTQWLPE